MRKVIFVCAAMAVILIACNEKQEQMNTDSAGYENESQENELILEEATVQATEVEIESESKKQEILREQIVGTWKMDGQKTQDGLKDHDYSLTALFGTGIQFGSELKVLSDGTISYYIGINRGGEGTWEWSENTIYADITPYVEEGNAERDLTFQAVEEEGELFLVMEYDGENIYWEKADD